ncbi:hypothetical protein [Natrinema sp. 1APR25-10V2]|uniref:hypothetical protein n=1 Tax=Natrinema sp. 1APR25-10V2 TaxID=2951081 RepID=UPI002874C156|nr:hypothetical protein [Natrinema sp. 1APR25-10V2]MDS0478636.1 hypothetical protein [Natrinema sp. 1APR25-10V2]
MSGSTTRSASEEGGLENIREASDAVEKSTTEITLEKAVERWRTVGTIAVLVAASVLLVRVDGYLSIDAQVFGGIAILLLIYFLATLRTDVRME